MKHHIFPRRSRGYRGLTNHLSYRRLFCPNSPVYVQLSFFWIVSSVFPYTCIMFSSAPVQRVFFQYKNKTWKQSIIFWIISSCFFRYCRFCWGSTLLRDAVLTFRFLTVNITLSTNLFDLLDRSFVVCLVSFLKVEKIVKHKKCNHKKEKKTTFHHFVGVKRHVACRSWEENYYASETKIPPNVKWRQLRWKPPIFRRALRSMNSFSNWKLCLYRGKEDVATKTNS